MNAVLVALVVSAFTAVPQLTPDAIRFEAARELPSPVLDLGSPLELPSLRNPCDAAADLRAVGRWSGTDAGLLDSGLFGPREPLLRPFGFIRGPREGWTPFGAPTKCVVGPSRGSERRR
jgi:hypothetical protein